MPVLSQIYIILFNRARTCDICYTAGYVGGWVGVWLDGWMVAVRVDGSVVGWVDEVLDWGFMSRLVVRWVTG